MREILFRGKRIDNGEWLGGSFLNDRDGSFYICPAVSDISYGDGGNRRRIGCWYKVDPSTVGQYTGLKDKNGKRIFEDDVCRFREWSKGEMCWVGKVHWEHQQFMISGGPNKECETMFELCLSRFIPENIEVIGNIMDNPELLENNLHPQISG